MADTFNGRQVCERALQIAGSLAFGETAPANMIEQARGMLNDLISTWQTERLFTWVINRNTSFSLVASTGSYIIGPGATFDTGATVGRPVEVLGASVMIGATSNQEYPLDRIATWQAWQDQNLKTTESSLPLRFYYEPSVGNGTLHFWPVPSGTLPLVLYLRQRLSSFADLTTNYTFADGYKRALAYNLAREIMAVRGRPASPLVEMIANESKGAVKSINIPMIVLRSDPALVGAGRTDYDITSDEYD